MQYTVINSSSDYISAFLLKFDEGIKFAKTVVAMGDEKELSSRGYLALGMGYSLLASEGNVLVVLGSTRDEMGQWLRTVYDTFQHLDFDRSL